MTVAEFIGDEVSAAGYRLCGVDVHIASMHNALMLTKQACERASLVLIGSSTAQYIDAEELNTLMTSIQPPVMIVPDIRELQSAPNMVAHIYKQLGMLE